MSDGQALRPPRGEKWAGYRWIDRGLTALSRGYLRGLGKLLQHRLQNCEIIAVGSAEQGLERLAQAPKPDAIVLDLNLPGMDGLSALSRLSRRSRMAA